MNILVGNLTTLGERHAQALFRLRHRVFRERLGWQVASRAGEERDAYDDADAAYVIACGEDGGVAGCLRLRPTLRPYLLASAFADLLDGAEPPRGPAVWELSRFALDGPRRGGWGFSTPALALVRAAAAFARRRGITRFVLATSTAIERLMAREGLHCRRLGTPRRIGDVESVALALEIDDATLRALGLDAVAPTPAHAVRHAPVSRPRIAPSSARRRAPSHGTGDRNGAALRLAARAAATIPGARP